jgi:hypothetical protein
MKLNDIDTATLETLDSACGGTFSKVKEYCLANGYEAHLVVLTHLDGLEKGQMKMCIQVVNDEETVDYGVARMGGPALVIGWNIYLADLLAGVRKRLNKVNADIDAFEEETKYDSN